MNGTIVPLVYAACKKAVIEKIQSQHHIAMTTDAWKSFAKQSYVTLTCHLIDHTGELHNVLLSTTEIKKRHTAENLRHHIQKEVVEWGLQSDIVTTNFNSTNANKIEDEAEGNDGDIDYLQEVGYYNEEEDEKFEINLNNISSDLTHMVEDYSQNSQESTQISKDSTQMSQDEVDRSHVRNVVSNTSVKPKATLSFVTDNARDIRKALKGIYQWLGCAAHHIILL